jgi:sugar phosphate isomerase/epimerase
MKMSQPLNCRLGCQAWTFNHITFFETIDKTAALGLSYVEAYPGQRLSPDEPDVVFDHNAPESVWAEVKSKLSDVGLPLLHYGVCDLDESEAFCRKIYDFAKFMGIETLVSEPDQEWLPMIDRLCNEYDIKLAIHNHPAPSRYWNPDAVVTACQDRSPYIGACADPGHWIRSGKDPLESLRKLEGRIISFHMKDVDHLAADAKDVVWGTGVGQVPEIIAEIKRQGIEPAISIEHELDGDIDPTDEVAECIQYYRSHCD